MEVRQWPTGVAERAPRLNGSKCGQIARIGTDHWKKFPIASTPVKIAPSGGGRTLMPARTSLSPRCSMLLSRRACRLLLDTIVSRGAWTPILRSLRTPRSEAASITKPSSRSWWRCRLIAPSAWANRRRRLHAASMRQRSLAWTRRLASRTGCLQRTAEALPAASPRANAARARPGLRWLVRSPWITATGRKMSHRRGEQPRDARGLVAASRRGRQALWFTRRSLERYRW